MEAVTDSEHLTMRIPTYLQAYAHNAIAQKQNITTFHLRASNGKTWFAIAYYGSYLSEKDKTVVSTDFAPLLIVATEPESGEQIVLFDGTRHGYNAMFCDEYSQEQHHSRPLSRHGNSLYQVKLEFLYQMDYEEEKDDFCDANGQVELIYGESINFETLQQNGFDVCRITLTDQHGTSHLLVDEELA